MGEREMDELTCGSMTKKKLEAYNAAVIEMVLIEQELAQYGQVQDNVKGSLTEHPYTVQQIRIVGITPAVAEMMRERRNKLAKLRVEVEQFLMAVDDPHMASLLRLRYIKGLKWEDVAAQIGGGNSVSGVRSAVERFLKSCAFCAEKVC